MSTKLFGGCLIGLLAMSTVTAAEVSTPEYPGLRDALMASAGWSDAGTSSARSDLDIQRQEMQIFSRAPIPQIAEPALQVPQSEWKADFARDLLPGPSSRLWRSLAFSFTWLDQPDDLFVGVRDIAPDGFIHNPDTILRKMDVAVSPARWFRTPSDYFAAYDLARKSATGALIDAGSDPLARGAPLADRLVRTGRSKLDYLAWSKQGGLVKRLASASTLSLGVSERATISGIQSIPEPIRSQDSDALTYSFKFDPDLLVVFPDQLAAAYAALEAHTALEHDNRSGLDRRECAELLSPIRCLRELSGVKLRGRWLAGALPTIKAETVDQFDFVSVGGNFVTSPLIEDSIETISVTWDLGTALNNADHRREAIKAIATHVQLIDRDTLRQDQLMVIGPAEVSFVEDRGIAIPLLLAYGRSNKTPSGTWKLCVFKSGSCDAQEAKSRNLTIDQTGEVRGYPPLGVHHLVVQVQDAHGNRATKETRLTSE